jgi:hypothetical protein
VSFWPLLSPRFSLQKYNLSKHDTSFHLKLRFKNLFLKISVKAIRRTIKQKAHMQPIPLSLSLSLSLSLHWLDPSIHPGSTALSNVSLYMAS